MYLQFAFGMLAGLCVIVALFGTISLKKRLLLLAAAVQLVILAMYPLVAHSAFAASVKDLLISLLIACAVIVLAIAWAICATLFRHRQKPWQMNALAFVAAGSMLVLLLQSTPH